MEYCVCKLITVKVNIAVEIEQIFHHGWASGMSGQLTQTPVAKTHLLQPYHSVLYLLRWQISFLLYGGYIHPEKTICHPVTCHTHVKEAADFLCIHPFVALQPWDFVFQGLSWIWVYNNKVFKQAAKSWQDILVKAMLHVNCNPI